MQIKKGKILFGYKDTYNMNDTLAKVIASGLSKYKEVLKEKNTKGIPCFALKHLEDKGIISPPVNSHYSDEDLTKGEEYFYEVLGEMIYAFEDKEPDMDDYDFRHDMERLSSEDGGITFPVTMTCTNKEEYARYNKDLEAHNERCLQGRLLFSEHFDSLWW